MPNVTKKIPFKACLLSLLIITGCSKYDGPSERQSHIEQYQKELSQRTNEVLASKDSFGLNDCIEIALTNNLDVRRAEVQKRISKLERKVAFSNFLPAVNLDYNYTKWNRQPKINFGAMSVPMQDQYIQDITWQIQMNIFDPSTWFLYTMHQRGEEIAEIVTQYTRQMTVLEVTINYYHCLSLKQIEQALQSQLNAATALEKEISSLYQEGMVTQWQAEQANVLVLEKQTFLASMGYAIKQAKADLLVSLGLSPLTEISLETEQILTDPNKSLEDLVAEALISNPQLRIADRNVAIEKEKVKVALAGFLPRLVGFANRTNSSNSYLVYDNFWTYGLSATLSVFNGFANINEYKATKEHRKDAFLEREQQTLVLMLEVTKAYLNTEDAKRHSLLAQKAFDASLTHFTEAKEKWREGLIDSSKMLDVMAKRDAAQMELANSHFRTQVSIATLYNVMGITETDYEEGKDGRAITKSN